MFLESQADLVGNGQKRKTLYCLGSRVSGSTRE